MLCYFCSSPGAELAAHEPLPAAFQCLQEDTSSGPAVLYQVGPYSHTVDMGNISSSLVALCQVLSDVTLQKAIFQLLSVIPAAWLGTLPYPCRRLPGFWYSSERGTVHCSQGEPAEVPSGDAGVWVMAPKHDLAWRRPLDLGHRLFWSAWEVSPVGGLSCLCRTGEGGWPKASSVRLALVFFARFAVLFVCRFDG